MLDTMRAFTSKQHRFQPAFEPMSDERRAATTKIEVGERAERYSRTAGQQIIIHYHDIGIVGTLAEKAEKIAEHRKRQTA
ncbi:MAG: hypothetical protein N2171_06370 [Clostridia bacterium]|nr:hypothetical protein [Clostridia bacterium]